jgi:hypothetical protein
VLARARQAHERAVPQVYKPPGSVVVSLDQASGKYTPAMPLREVSFELDEGI